MRTFLNIHFKALEGDEKLTDHNLVHSNKQWEW